jgi:alkylhydroperoxidase family enzyme
MKRRQDMEARINAVKVAPGIIEAMLGLSSYVRKSGLEESLVNLIFLRASQINGCAYCIDMHWTPGKNLLTTPIASARLWPGPRR